MHLPNLRTLSHNCWYQKPLHPVVAEGKIIGPSGSGRDKMLVLATTAGGAYIGTLAGKVASRAPVKGALIGGGVGAAASLIAILLTRGPEAELPRGTMLDVVFDHELILDVDHLPANDPGRLSQPLWPVHCLRRPMRANALEAARRLACRFRFCNFRELTNVLL